MKKTYCVACNSSKELHHHHLLPRSKGGTDAETNLITLCVSCHGIMHDTSWSNNHAQLVSEGIAKAKASGVRLGPKPKDIPNIKNILCTDKPTIMDVIVCLFHVEKINTSSIMKMTWGELLLDKTSYSNITQKMIEGAAVTHGYTKKYFTYLICNIGKEGSRLSPNSLNQRIGRQVKNGPTYKGITLSKLNPHYAVSNQRVLLPRHKTSTSVREENKRILEWNKENANKPNFKAKKLIDLL